MEPRDDHQDQQIGTESADSGLSRVTQVLRHIRELVRGISSYFSEGDGQPTSARDDIRSAFGHLQWRRVARVLTAVVFLTYLGSGAYVVNPGEVGVVRTFGAVTSDRIPEGLHWHMPWPVQRVDKVNMKLVRREGIGVDIPEHRPPICPPGMQFHVLSGDENIVNLKLIAQYNVQNASDYLFSLRFEPYGIIRNAVNSAAIQVVAQMTVDDILTGKKTEAQNRIRHIAQQILDNYQSGLALVSINFEEVAPPEEVRDAFKEVASAKEEAAKRINDAEAYRNSLLAQAQGDASKVVTDAEGYSTQIVEQAKGDADKFQKILAEYHRNTSIYTADVTKQRYFLETMEKIMPRVKKYIVGSGTGRVNLRFFESGLPQTSQASPPQGAGPSLPYQAPPPQGVGPE